VTKDVESARFVAFPLWEAWPTARDDAEPGGRRASRREARALHKRTDRADRSRKVRTSALFRSPRTRRPAPSFETDQDSAQLGVTRLARNGLNERVVERHRGPVGGGSSRRLGRVEKSRASETATAKVRWHYARSAAGRRAREKDDEGTSRVVEGRDAMGAGILRGSRGIRNGTVARLCARYAIVATAVNPPRLRRAGRQRGQDSGWYSAARLPTAPPPPPRAELLEAWVRWAFTVAR